ncbi:phosphopantetheine-binding protein [Campylobacter jejuni]|uniref:phosphopantetheine-binding protein n=1 Tax=Campylobacter jejuni TaxID=197 RepID=UPI000873DB90|nr:phosphopantetheine-binding protein [Campylobacter jejuni]AXL34617.1 acyl carrier protein [Campylobacter jejuni]OEW86105.1 acyl carrier protein [Campylobacter jejuni]RTH82884.1 acyl carrier protein [Campylobacter jejuni]
MQEIKQFFINIGKGHISEFDVDILSSGMIDSVDIMNLVAEIEKYYNVEISFDFIIPENFESFIAIQNMIDKVRI